MRAAAISFLAFALVSCSSGFRDIDPESLEMGSTAEFAQATELYVEPEESKEKRAEFKERLKASGNTSRGKRELYEQYIDALGANGVLDVIEEVWPKCHSEGHALGKIIYERVENVGLGLRICADGCYSGCMHGVLMEAFSGIADSDDPEGHIDPAKLKSLMDEVCYETDSMRSAYSEGDCAHAIGHAMTVLAEYDVAAAVDYCEGFENPVMDYYCATGAYMEYVTERDDDDVATRKRALYPCDVGKYPAACARYKMVHVIKRLVKKKSDVRKLVRSCNQLQGTYRLGCYHGAGNGFMGFIVKGNVTLPDVCGQGTDDERFVCIEGAMERMAKYHPKSAKSVCASLPKNSVDRETCEASRERGMYDMEKDMRLYLN